MTRGRWRDLTALVILDIYVMPVFNLLIIKHISYVLKIRFCMPNPWTDFTV